MTTTHDPTPAQHVQRPSSLHKEPEFRRYSPYDLPVVSHSADYEDGNVTDWHYHPHVQLIHAAQGVMRVSTEQGQWVVPPSRAIWMPAFVAHTVRMIGQVQMRTVFIRPDAAPDLWDHCQVVGVSPLLRELLLASTQVQMPYVEDSRDGHLMRLILDEIHTLPTLALELPTPTDPRLQIISQTLRDNPDDPTTIEMWAERLHVATKTIHRLFARETGMTFGQWRQQVRLLAALERLAQGEKVVAVALEMGYSSPSAFATMFKRQFGVSPSQFFE